MGVTDSTTAVEGMQSSAASEMGEPLQKPPISAYRKKRKRTYAPAPEQPKQTYWSEYDHPEDLDGADDANAYYIYVDPNETSAMSRLVDKLRHVFTRRASGENSSLLSPSSRAEDDESSSDEEASIPKRPQHAKSYGTLAFTAPHSDNPHRRSQAIPHVTATCLVASLIILVVAYILAMTGKHKLATEVYAGVLLAVVSSLVFAIVGMASLLRGGEHGWVPWTVAVGVLAVDAVGAGGLLAWMLG